MAFPGDAIPSDFWVGWDVPIRAYPGLALTHKLTYYEVDNRSTSWSLSGAPAGMVIQADGTVSWPTPIAGTYAGITATATRSGRNTTDFPSASLTATRTFTCVCSTSQYVFVATTGSDGTGTGLIGAPYATISKAVSTITGAGGGKCVLVRGGSYTENLSSAYWGGQTFTIGAYAEIANYHGENVDVTGLLWLADTCQYAVIRGGDGGTLTVHGCAASEGANLKVHGTHQVVKDAISYGATCLGDNTSGVLIDGDDVVGNRLVSYSNKTNVGNSNNYQNYIIYNGATGGPPGVKWLLNSKGWDSTWNIKIKHTNADLNKCIIHNFESVGKGIIGCGKNSSIRYCVVYESDTGVSLSLTDPSAYTQAAVGMLVEHCTVVSSSAANDCFEIGGNYLTAGVKLRRNIFYQSHGAPGGGNDVRKFMQLWQFDSPLATVQARTIDSDYNCFRNTTSSSSGWIVGSNGVSATTYDFTGYKALTGVGITRDPNSFTADPGFTNVATGNLNITSSSNAATLAGAGEYAGAFRPDQIYGTVGVQNTTLLVWDGNNPDPEPPSATDTIPVYLDRKKRGTRGKGRFA